MITSTIRDVFSNVVIGMTFILLIIVIFGLSPKLWAFLTNRGDKYQKNIFTSFWGVVLFLGAYCIGICIIDFGDYVITSKNKRPTCSIYKIFATIPRFIINIDKDDFRYSTLIEGDTLNPSGKDSLTSLGKSIFNHKGLINYYYEKLDTPKYNFNLFYDSVRRGYKNNSKVDKLNRKLIIEIYYVSHNYCISQSTLCDELGFYNKKIDFFIGLTLLSSISLTFSVFFIVYSVIFLIRSRRLKKKRVNNKHNLLEILCEIWYILQRSGCRLLILSIFGLLLFVFRDGIKLAEFQFNERVYGYYRSNLDIEGLKKYNEVSEANIDNAIYWVKSSGEYKACCIQTYNMAFDFLKRNYSKK